jgi:tetratricopeptide (TPR) repeat protein
MTDPTAEDRDDRLSSTRQDGGDATTGAAIGGAAASDDPMLMLARAGDWRTLADVGRFGLAAQTLRLTGGGEIGTLEALTGLADVEAAVRTKSVARARKRFERIDARPPDLVDWEGIGADLEALATAVPAVDRRELDEARTALAGLRTHVFAAERDALVGTMAILEGDTEAGLAAFEATLALDPGHVRALTNRGNIKLETGDVEGAIADYERAIKIDDTFANAHHNLGVAYRRQGNVGKSVAALRRAQRHAAKRDSEEARATIRVGAPAGSRRWLRWLAFGAVGVVLLWWLQQRGII